jgi:hypothetical protein
MPAPDVPEAHTRTEIGEHVSRAMRTGAVGALLFAAAAWGTPARAAGGGYAGTSGGALQPAGIAPVLTSATVSTGGATLSGANRSFSAVVDVPRGAVASPVQVEVTAPDPASFVAAPREAGLRGYGPVAAVALTVRSLGGGETSASAGRPMEVVLTGPALAPNGERVLALRSGAASLASAAQARPGLVSFPAIAGDSYVVVAPHAVPAAAADAFAAAPRSTSWSPFDPAVPVAVVGALGVAASVAVWARRRSPTSTR